MSRLSQGSRRLIGAMRVDRYSQAKTAPTRHHLRLRLLSQQTPNIIGFESFHRGAHILVKRHQMRKLFFFSILLVSTAAFGETCTLQTYASSWMETGTPFSAECPSGIYSGILITTPARRFFRRGHMMLKFDQPVTLRATKARDEGKLQPGHGKQIASMLMAGGVGIGAKDITDGLSGAVYKSWYAIPISGVTLAFFSNGGDVNLKRGARLEIVPLRN
jgi:cell division protein FtsW (lipid II flippase)